MSPGLPLSVIVPVLNEEARLPRALASLASLMRLGAEVVVVDGGSLDNTVACAHRAGVKVIGATRGRARQQNLGAKVARGELLAFLHADTLPCLAAIERLVALAQEPVPCWGRFDVRIDAPGGLFRVIEWAMNTRSRLTRIATGDALIFVSRSLFDAAGGFPQIDLMEDIAISKRLRALQRPILAREQVVTSARRWQRQGPVRTMALMWWLRARYAAGGDPARLAQAYRVGDTE